MTAPSVSRKASIEPELIGLARGPLIVTPHALKRAERRFRWLYDIDSEPGESFGDWIRGRATAALISGRCNRKSNYVDAHCVYAIEVSPLTGESVLVTIMKPQPKRIRCGKRKSRVRA